MIARSIVQSRWFYVGIPLLVSIAAFSIGAWLLIFLGVGHHYHPVAPIDDGVVAGKLLLGLSAAALLSLILMAIAKFGFRSPRRNIFLVVGVGIWLGWLTFLQLSFQPGEDAYRRIFESERYVIPWNRVPGELTSQGNPLRRWDRIATIGFRYCADPFQSNTVTDCSREGVALLSNDKLAFSHDLDIKHDDPDGVALRAHLERGAAQPEDHISSASSTGSSSTSSTSGGDNQYRVIRAERIKDIGGMIAYRRVSDYDYEQTLYLFDKRPEVVVHRAECRRKISDGKVVGKAFMCTHMDRTGSDTWITQHMLEDTAHYDAQLKKLRQTLDGFKK